MISGNNSFMTTTDMMIHLDLDRKKNEHIKYVSVVPFHYIAGIFMSFETFTQSRRGNPNGVNGNYQSIFAGAFAAAAIGIFLPVYPNPSNQGHISLLLTSNDSMAATRCIVRLTSSSPLSKQCRRYRSKAKANGGLPPTRRISCSSKSTSSSSPASASSASTRQSATGSVIGNMPFCIVFVRKISAKLGAIMQRIPKSNLYVRYGF